MIAALYVMKGGPYSSLEGVDAWDVDRDARDYAGPYPVVAHPPCKRWGRYWDGGPSARGRFTLGDDGGCFRAALASVRAWGGVLEHPEGSHAWAMFGLLAPPMRGWVADISGGWTCRVEQGFFGHRARKATWLYTHGVRPLPSLKWGDCGIRRDVSGMSPAQAKRARKTGVVQNMGRRERMATPAPFRDLLLSMARNATVTE